MQLYKLKKKKSKSLLVARYSRVRRLPKETNYRFSSNKRPPCFLNFEIVWCGAY